MRPTAATTRVEPWRCERCDAPVVAPGARCEQCDPVRRVPIWWRAVRAPFAIVAVACIGVVEIGNQHWLDRQEYGLPDGWRWAVPARPSAPVTHCCARCAENAPPELRARLRRGGEK